MRHRFPSTSWAPRAVAVLGILLPLVAAVRSASSYTATSAPSQRPPVVSRDTPRPLTPAPPAAVAIECMATDGFESDSASRWTREGTWAVTTPFAHTGTFSFTDSPPYGVPYESCLEDGCGYISSSATFQPIALDPGSAAKVEFDHICITENCVPPAPPCDAGIVELSTDGGANWDELARYDMTSDPAWADGIANPEDWRHVSMDLSYYAGQTVIVRLRLESDQLLAFDGWYIDNFHIEGCTVTPTLVTGFRAVAEERGVRLTLELADESPGAMAIVHRADTPDEAARAALTTEPLRVDERRFEYLDATLEPGRRAWYWVELREQDGAFFSGPVSATMPGALLTFAAAPTPNPVATHTSFAYVIGGDVAASGPVEMALTVHDLQGRLVRTLAKGNQGAGRYRVDWDVTDDRGARVAPGVYYARFRAGALMGTSTLAVIR